MAMFEDQRNEKLREAISRDVINSLDIALEGKKKLRSRVEDFLRKYLRVCLHPLGEKVALTDYRRQFYVYGKIEDPKIIFTLTKIVACVVSSEFRLKRGGKHGNAKGNCQKAHVS